IHPPTRLNTSIMKYHILNGDSLAETFKTAKIPGEIIVIREAFIEGPVTIDFTNEYWERRKQFIHSAYGEEGDYAKHFLSQLARMESINSDDEVYMWFEDDLFCQANMWFAIYFISAKTQPKFFRVFPREEKDHWSGFGRADKKELIACFDKRVEFSQQDISLSNKLWEAYVANDSNTLKLLSSTQTNCFRFLKDVIQAHVSRFPEDGSDGRPQQTLIEILNKGKSDFYEIFEEFSKREGIYGFGDMQVYNMLNDMEIEFRGDVI